MLNGFKALVLTRTHYRQSYLTIFTFRKITIDQSIKPALNVLTNHSLCYMYMYATKSQPR